MDRPCDTQPGMKHRCTNAAMEYFRGEVMEMCHAAGLYQIDLFSSKERVSEREYWAKKKGQLAVDEENAALAEQSLPVKQTKFETDKDKLRKQIRSVLSAAVSYEDFAEKLLQLGITVKESRGRLSYLTPDRTKPITARKLGDDFDKAAVLTVLNQNAQRAKVQTAPKRSTQVHGHQPEAVSRMVDIEAKRAEGKGQGYIHWAKIHNLKNASKAYLLYQEMGFSSPEELDTAYQETHARFEEVRTNLKSIETAITEKKELQRHVLNYFKTKDIREGLKACKSAKERKAYREKYESDFILIEAAKKYFDSKGLKKLPGYKTLQKEIEEMIAEKNELYNEYYELKKKDKELGTVRHNVDQILNGALTRKQEQNKKQTQGQEL